MSLKKPKHVAESCKFIKYLIKKCCVRLYFIMLFNEQRNIQRERLTLKLLVEDCY
jgi:hypothetical protein